MKKKLKDQSKSDNNDNNDSTKDSTEKATELDSKTLDVSNCNPNAVAMIKRIIQTRSVNATKTTRNVAYRSVRIAQSSGDIYHHMTIDGGADTTLCEKGWTFLEYSMCKANVIGCIEEMMSRDRPIGLAITAVD